MAHLGGGGERGVGVPGSELQPTRTTHFQAGQTETHLVRQGEGVGVPGYEGPKGRRSISRRGNGRTLYDVKKTTTPAGTAAPTRRRTLDRGGRGLDSGRRGLNTAVPTRRRTLDRD